MGKDGSPLGLGIITVFTVLVVLCMATLASLAVSSAQADLRLARVNGDTVTAYYRADSLAARAYADFLAGDESELEELIPMTDTQGLRVHLIREEDGTVTALAWQTVSLSDSVQTDTGLDVWDGTLSEGGTMFHDRTDFN